MAPGTVFLPTGPGPQGSANLDLAAKAGFNAAVNGIHPGVVAYVIPVSTCAGASCGIVF
jgi:hypothetical protein